MGSPQRKMSRKNMLMKRKQRRRIERQRREEAEHIQDVRRAGLVLPSKVHTPTADCQCEDCLTYDRSSIM